MSYQESSYLHQLKALLPRGTLWDRLREPGKLFGELLSVFAAEFARVDASNATLLDEADPRTTVQLLPEWESFASLPDSCSPVNQTLQQRRSALEMKLSGASPVSRADLIAVAASMGLVITINEYKLNRYGTRYGGIYGGIEWQFTWDVVIPGPGPEVLLECMISRYAPAGFIVRFKYV